MTLEYFKEHYSNLYIYILLTKDFTILQDLKIKIKGAKNAI